MFSLASHQPHPTPQHPAARCGAGQRTTNARAVLKNVLAIKNGINEKQRI